MSDKIFISIHKCDSAISAMLKLVHKYPSDMPKFSHYAMSFVSIHGNRIYIDVAEHNFHLSHKNHFDNRWRVVGFDHVFEVDRDKFEMWLEPKLGRIYGYWTLLGHAFKKVFHLKKNPFGDGQKSFICNEIALQFLNDFFNAGIDTENLDLVQSEKIIDEIKKKFG